MTSINAYRLLLREIKQQDLEVLREWRNAPEVRLNMIDQNIITEKQQLQWFLSLAQQQQLHYIVEYKNIAIGYANFKPDKDGQGGQTGLYIGEAKYRGTILAFCLALALLDHVFLNLNVKHLKAEVLQHNKAAIRFNEQLGYRYKDELAGVVKMILTKNDYVLAKEQIIQLIRI